jgi:PAS domain S-box-containing protein
MTSLPPAAAAIAIARLASIVDSSDDAIISKTLEGVITSWNSGAERIFGYTAEEAIGRHIGFIIPPDRIAEEDLVLSRIRAGLRIDHFETVRRTKDGRDLSISLTVSPLRDGTGMIVGASKVARDMTQIRQAEIDLARLAAIVESSDDAIISKTLDGVITSWNTAAQKMFGYTPEEAIGRHITLIIPPERRSEEELVIGRLRRGERIEHFETERRAKDGRLLAISLSVSPIRDAKGTIVGASKVARDITQQRTAEVEREQLLISERAARTEAERASRMKDEFLATLGHELRTPLSAILGWAQILGRKTPDPALLAEGLEVIQRNARLQSRLIADLLDMSRIISGKMRLDIERVELALIIENAIESVRPAAEAKDVRIVSVIEPSIGPLQGDPARLQQVVWNLLSNAVKFTPKGGNVQVVLARVNSHVELAVSDTGKGMKAELVPHVFERFRQGDSSSTRQHGGLGLGLAIVKQLTELHGGSVAAFSEGEGRGSTFTVSLPIAARERPPSPRHASLPSAPPIEEAEPQALKGVRVLVVDDEPDARELVRRLLHECQAEVSVACSVDEALAATASKTFDVILSDISMPGRDGYEFIQELRKAGKRTPAAALTAFARSEDRTRALKAGYQTHITKPVEPTELVAAVAALVQVPRDASASA